MSKIKNLLKCILLALMILALLRDWAKADNFENTSVSTSEGDIFFYDSSNMPINHSGSAGYVFFASGAMGNNVYQIGIRSSGSELVAETYADFQNTDRHALYAGTNFCIQTTWVASNDSIVYFVALNGLGSEYKVQASVYQDDTCIERIGAFSIDGSAGSYEIELKKGNVIQFVLSFSNVPVFGSGNSDWLTSGGVWCNFSATVTVEGNTDIGDEVDPMLTPTPTPVPDYSDGISESNKNTKGIWDSILDLPGKIADAIGGFFVDLGNNILEGLKALFIPADFKGTIEEGIDNLEEGLGLFAFPEIWLAKMYDAVINGYSATIDLSIAEYRILGYTFIPAAEISVNPSDYIPFDPLNIARWIFTFLCAVGIIIKGWRHVFTRQGVVFDGFIEEG